VIHQFAKKQQPTTPGENMNDESAINREIDLTNRYMPSGRTSSRTIKVYVVFSLIGAIVVQIPFGLTEGLMGFFVRFSSGIWVVLSPILFGVLGFAISGGILMHIVGLGTKRGQGRNPLFTRLFIILATVLAFPIRLIVTLGLGALLNEAPNSVLDLPSPYWVETLIGFGVVLTAALLVMPKEMDPYCESCARYMKTESAVYHESCLLNILNELKHFKAEGYTGWRHTPELEARAHEDKVTVTLASGEKSSASPEAALTLLETGLAELQAQYSKRHPDVVRLKAEIATVKTLIKHRKAGEEVTFPSAQLILHLCEQCGDGYINVKWNTLKLVHQFLHPVDQMQRETKSIYWDHPPANAVNDVKVTLRREPHWISIRFGPLHTRTRA
jgi:hypothetical protein